MSMTSDPLETPERVQAFMADLTFRDEPVAVEDLPPLPVPGEDALVPRSFKLPARLDAALEQLAEARNVNKSVLVRQYLEAAVTADLAARQGGGVLIPLADALRALASLGQLPHTA